MSLNLSSVAKEIIDPEVRDMFNAFLKLANERIIAIQEEEYCLNFRTIPSDSSNESFLGYVGRVHKQKLYEIAFADKVLDIWFLSFYHTIGFGSAEEDERIWFDVWLKFDDNGKSYISLTDGQTNERDLSVPEEVGLLRQEMKGLLDKLLTLKALFYDEYNMKVLRLR